MRLDSLCTDTVRIVNSCTCAGAHGGHARMEEYNDIVSHSQTAFSIFLCGGRKESGLVYSCHHKEKWKKLKWFGYPRLMMTVFIARV